MLATTAHLYTRQAPLAVGLLLRGPRSVPAAARALRTARGVAAGAGPAGPDYTILEYDYVHTDAELIAGREPYLDEHLSRCRDMADAGKLVLWGSVGRPATGGMLIWRGADEAEVAAWVKRDPLVANGLVRHWTTKPFHVHVEDRK